MPMFAQPTTMYRTQLRNLKALLGLYVSITLLVIGVLYAAATFFEFSRSTILITSLSIGPFYLILTGLAASAFVRFLSIRKRVRKERVVVMNERKDVRQHRKRTAPVPASAPMNAAAPVAHKTSLFHTFAQSFQKRTEMKGEKKRGAAIEAQHAQKKALFQDIRMAKRELAKLRAEHKAEESKAYVLKKEVRHAEVAKEHVLTEMRDAEIMTQKIKEKNAEDAQAAASRRVQKTMEADEVSHRSFLGIFRKNKKGGDDESKSVKKESVESHTVKVKKKQAAHKKSVGTAADPLAEIKKRYEKLPSDYNERTEMQRYVARKVQEQKGLFSIADVLSVLSQVYDGADKQRVKLLEEVKRWATEDSFTKPVKVVDGVTYYKLM
jgi:hypothetical protein